MVGAGDLVTDGALALKRRARREAGEDERAATSDGQVRGGEHRHGFGECPRRDCSWSCAISRESCIISCNMSRVV